MPRIPQGEFDTNPSTRVGAAYSARPATGAMETVGKAVTNLIGMAAQLQDQHERSEAYQKANEVKRNYLQQKATYEAALETVDGSGNVDYFDPTDSNPDVSKRRRIKRPAHEMYEEMVSSYEEQKKELSKISRPDIALDLSRQYVGDDLVQTQMKTNKLINRQREKETLHSVQENMELNLLEFTTKATSEGASEDSINLALSHMNNKMARDLGAASSVLGGKTTMELMKLKDRAYATTAQQIISTGLTNGTAKAADQLINRIKDPSTKSLAITRLENAKRTSEARSLAVLNQASGLDQSLSASAVIDDQTYAKTINTVEQTLGIYVDPKYSTVLTEDLKKEQSGRLLSTALAARQSVELMDADLTFLDDPTSDVDESNAERGIAGQTEGPKMRALKEQIRQEMEASGISKRIGGDEAYVNNIVDQTVEKMRQRKMSMKDHVSEMVSLKHPNARGMDKLALIDHTAEMNRLGEVNYVSPKEHQVFAKTFKTAIATDTNQAANVFMQAMATAGEGFEGKKSYRRSYAMGLAGKDASLSFLIPAADMDHAQAQTAIEEASLFKRVTSEVDGLNPTMFHETFSELKHNLPALNSIERSNPTMYDGVKQIIMHKAAAKLHDANGKAGDVKRYMKEALQDIKKTYTSVSDGGSSIFALNRGRNYENVESTTIYRGMQKATTLPQLTKEQKIDVLKRYQSQIAHGVQISEHTPDDHIDWLLKQNVRIEPDARNPNIHVAKIRGKTLSTRDGVPFDMHVDDIIKHGVEEDKKYTSQSMQTQTFMRR